MNIAQIRFCHDLEDGWYRLTTSTGLVIERNQYIDIINYCRENNINDYEWVGDNYYNPEKLNDPLRPWMNTNYKTGRGESPNGSCCQKHKDGLCEFHNPETYIKSNISFLIQENAKIAVWEKILKKLTPTEVEFLASYLR